MRKKRKTYITLGGLSLLLISLFFLIKSILFAQNQPAVSLYVIQSPTSTWESYQEEDLVEIGCRLSELPSGLPNFMQLRTPEEFLNLRSAIEGSPCNTRSLGAKAPMYYVLRVSKDNPLVSFYNANNRKVLDFDIRNLGREKESYYEISGPLNPNSTIDRWEIDVKNTAGQVVDTLQFYLASDNLTDFPAEQQKFAGFLFYRDYTTHKENVPSPSTLDFTFFSSPMFCGQNYLAVLRENTGKIAIAPPEPVPLNNQPTNFSRTLYANTDTQANLWLAESRSNRQLTPTISLSILGGGGLNLGITNLDLIVNVATSSGYATCVNATATLIAEVTNTSDEGYNGGDTITLSINGYSEQQDLGQINAYESKTYSMTWIPTVTGTYTFTATLNLEDAFSNDNSASIDILVYSQNMCPKLQNYYCVGGFCYSCPGNTVPPSASCQLKPNQECIQAGISCEPQVRE